MILEIHDKSYERLLQLIVEGAELREQREMLFEKTYSYPFNTVEYYEDLPEELLKELNAIFAEMQKLSVKIDHVNEDIAIIMENNI